MGSIVMEPDDLTTYASIYHPGANYSSICLTIGHVNSRGVFNDSNPLDYSFPLLTAQLAIASLVILFTSCFLKPLGQTSMIIQIVGGLILGPSLLGQIPGFTANIYPYESLFILDALASFGYMFYFFLIGVQMDPWILKNIQKKDIFIGISIVSLATALSLSTSSILLTSFPISKAIAKSLKPVAILSSIVSFPVVAHYLTELKMLNSEFGRRTLSVSLASNFFGFVLEIIAYIGRQTGGNMLQNIQTLLTAVLFVVVMVFVVRPIILWNIKGSFEGKPLNEVFFCIVLVGVVVSGFCSKALGVDIFFGPFVYGMTIPAGPPLGSALMEKLDLVTSWIFMPLYFVKNGLVTDISLIRFEDYWVVQFIILLACLGKFLGALVSAVLCKVPLKEATSIGLVMNVQGVLDLGMFKLLKQSKALQDGPFVTLCLSMVFVTACMTPMLRRLHDPLKRHAVQRKKTIMDMKPNSELRILTCIHDQEDVPPIINLIDKLNPTKHTPIQIFLLHLAELSGRAHPILIRHKLNRVTESSEKASTSRSIFNAFKLLQQSHGHGAITVNPFTAISPYETMHDEVCEMAINRGISLIVTPFHQRSAETGIAESSEAGYKMVNDKILEMAPCTVGIIAGHRSVIASRPDVESSGLHRVAVFFIGGPDDWEALAIGAKMVFQLNVSLTVVRIIAESSVVGVRESYVIDEFKKQVEGNRNVMFVEKEVKDGTGICALIRSVEDYELVIVGRNHDPRSPLMEGISGWSDYSELGAIGDIFASDSDSHSSILVVQQQNEL